MLLLAILLLHWSENVHIKEDATQSKFYGKLSISCDCHKPKSAKSVEWLEYFAGNAEVSKHVRACGYKARKFDLLYCEPSMYRHHNYMDMLSPAGMAFYAQLPKPT